MQTQSRTLPPKNGYTLAGWGDESVCIEIAHCITELSGLNQYQQAVLEKRYAMFLAPRESVTSQCRVLPDRTAAREPERFVGPTGEYAMELAHSAESIEVTGYNFRVVLSMEPELNGRLWAQDEMELTQDTVMENYLRVVTAYAALFQGGLLLHSAGFVLEGRAHLFLGRSGAGKTTLSRLALAAGAKVLSDDINVIMPDNGGYVALPVPFAGELRAVNEATAGHFPLAGVHIIEKGAPLRIKPLSSGECLSKLLICTPFVNEDPFRLDRVMDTVIDLSQSCAGGMLRFGSEDAFESIEALLLEYNHDKS